MKIFATSPEDNKNSVMRVEMTGNDIELLEEVVDRLRRLEKIEAALDVVGMVSPTIFGVDQPTVTKDGADFLEVLVKGWDAETEIEYKLNGD